MASDDVSQAELLAFWRQVRRVDWNVPFLMVLNDRLPHRQAMLRYGYDSAVEVSEGIIAIRSAAELLLQASEGRVLDALAEEERTISHEIMERLAALDSRVERSREAVARAAEHQLRAMAYDAFDAAGGTRSHFEKLWPDVFNNLASEKRDRRE